MTEVGKRWGKIGGTSLLSVLVCPNQKRGLLEMALNPLILELDGCRIGQKRDSAPIFLQRPFLGQNGDNSGLLLAPGQLLW